MTVIDTPTLIATGAELAAVTRAIVHYRHARRQAGMPPDPVLERIAASLAHVRVDVRADTDQEAGRLTTGEAAQLLGRSARTVRRMADRLDGTKTDQGWRIPAAAVLEHLGGRDE